MDSILLLFSKEEKVTDKTIFSHKANGYLLNTYLAAGVYTSKISLHFFKNLNSFKFDYHIWIHHGKCIQISTNMPSIGLEIPEIGVEIRNLRKPKTYFMPNLITAC